MIRGGFRRTEEIWVLRRVLCVRCTNRRRQQTWSSAIYEASELLNRSFKSTGEYTNIAWLASATHKLVPTRSHPIRSYYEDWLFIANRPQQDYPHNNASKPAPNGLPLQPLQIVSPPSNIKEKKRPAKPMCYLGRGGRPLHPRVPPASRAASRLLGTPTRPGRLLTFLLLGVSQGAAPLPRCSAKGGRQARVTLGARLSVSAGWALPLVTGRKNGGGRGGRRVIKLTKPGGGGEELEQHNKLSILSRRRFMRILRFRMQEYE